MSTRKPTPLDTNIVSIGITREPDETWRECVARLVEEAGEGAVEDALAVFDHHAAYTGHAWAALRACWDFLACEREGV